MENKYYLAVEVKPKNYFPINLLDLKLASVFPIFREETIENFERLYYANSLNKTR